MYITEIKAKLVLVEFVVFQWVTGIAKFYVIVEVVDYRIKD